MTHVVTAADIAAYADALLGCNSFPDYPSALNGLQLDHRGPVRGVAAAVDFSIRTLEGTVAAKANLLLVHHGMFWGGVQRLTGRSFRRLQLAFAHDIAVYAAHLPLDAHPTLGNCTLLAHELGLEPTARFGQYQTTDIGVAGECALTTQTLLMRAREFATQWGGTAIASPMDPARQSRRWAVVTGAGADSTTLREAANVGIDTLIVGEGPHHTAVDAPELGIVVIYAGHYATETLGVQALATSIATHFDVPWTFIDAPTGL